MKNHYTSEIDLLCTQSMALKSYKNYLDDRGFNGYEVLTKNGSKRIGTVVDLLIDDQNLFLQYLVVKPARRALRSNMLIPLQACRIDYKKQCFHILNL